MIDVTKKFDPIPLPTTTGAAPTAGPRIGEPVPAPTPKSPAGPVLANKPDASPAAPPGAAPAPAWVKEAIGKLLSPTRTKAAVAAAAVALGGGMYVAKVFTGDKLETPAPAAVLEVGKADPPPAHPHEQGAPHQLPPLHPTGTASLTPTPTLSFAEVPTLSAPTAADQFRYREVTPPGAALPDLTRTAATTPTLPDLSRVPTPVLPDAGRVPAPVLPDAGRSMTTVPSPQPPGGFASSVPSIDVPVLPGASPIRPVDNTGGSSVGLVLPAVPTGGVQPPPSAPATPTSAPPIPSIGDVPSLGGGVGGGAITSPPLTSAPAPVPSLTAPTTPVPSLTTPPATVTAAPPPAPVLPTTPTGSGGGSIGGASVVPQPITAPVMSAPTPPVGFDTVRPTTPTPPVPTFPKETDTSFDVDVHTVKRGDTYASISKSYYGDAAFGDALRMYDESRPGHVAGTVHVPPIWVLRKNYPQGMRGDAPVTPAATVPAERPTTVPVTTTSTTAPDWGTSRTNPKAKAYTIAKPMTMRDVAKEAFGDEAYWATIWNMNLNLSTDGVLPIGTKVNLPADARIGQ
jgi:nucleoid-associated protein YgaU